ncbi:MAG: hypothetical protein FJ397_00005 [Verrucomicrobia bacterium]|nr:hypothetical protein [Verrucomicrobiota bacterium]
MRSPAFDPRRWAALLAGSSALLAAPPADAPPLPLSELTPGRRGEVWTVFRGTEPEPFSVVVTGVIQNGLGPGKSLIVCELTDPRVQPMGAVAGMSGSPLYVDGKLAGALSYQIQRFETVRHAGFTPVADLEEVRALPSPGTRLSGGSGGLSPATPLQPAFSLAGLSPVAVAALGPLLAELGLGPVVPGGVANPAQGVVAAAEPRLAPGGAVAVALATGDITLAATGTVSLVRGREIVAFGHPLLALGEVALPLCHAEVLTILPSQMQSVKVANIGPVIGTIRQDRLSAVAGELGPGPAMIPVEITRPGGAAPLRFATARHPQLAPLVVGAGVSQAVLGANDAGFNEGFRVASHLRFPGGLEWRQTVLHAGAQGFAQSLGEIVQSLAAVLQNPLGRVYPDAIRLEVEALRDSPGITVDRFVLSRATAAPGAEVTADLSWRDPHGRGGHLSVPLPIAADWSGRTLEVVLAPGRVLDELTGRPRTVPAVELRSLEAYLRFLQAERRRDGLFLAVLQRATLLTDQTRPTVEAPASLERIARTADDTRYQRRESSVVLWEAHVLPERLSPAVFRRALTVAE